MVTRNAILNKTRQGHTVNVLKDGRVMVSGSRAVNTAIQLQKEGLVKFTNLSEYTRIGNKADGSCKYGMVFAGYCEIL